MIKIGLVLLIIAVAILDDSIVSLSQLFLEKRAYHYEGQSKKATVTSSESYSSSLNPTIYKDKIIHMTLTNNDSLRYTTKLQVGSNKQEISVQFDTGSYFFVLPDASLANNFINTFDCSKSSTCEKFTDMKLSITYGSSSLRGHGMRDQFSLGGDFAITPDVAILVTEWNKTAKTDIDSIFGLGYQRYPDQFIRSKGVEPTGCSSFNFVQSLKQKGIVDKSQFAFFFDNNSSKKLTAEFMIGGYDPKYAKGEMVFLDVISDNQWDVRFNSVTIGNEKIAITSGNGKALLDTGTSVITFPKFIYQYIHEYIQKNTECDQIVKLFCVCNKTGAQKYVELSQFPDIKIELDGMTAYLKPEAYVRIYNNLTLVEIMSFDTDNDIIILGDTFIRQYLTLFDYDQGKIGLAPSINYNGPISTESSMSSEPKTTVNYGPSIDAINV